MGRTLSGGIVCAAAAISPAVPAAKPAPEAIEEPHTLKINAKEVTWIRVVIDDGNPFEVLLDEGDSISWEASRVFFADWKRRWRGTYL